MLAFTAAARVLPDFSLPALRTQLVRSAGVGAARSSALLEATFIGKGDVASRLRIGAGSLIAPQVVFGLDERITIGSNVSIGP